MNYQKLKKHGAHKILKPLFDDIRKLESVGLDLNINGEDVNYKGTLLLLSADNPAAAFLGGFKQSVSAYRLCRTCFTTRDQWKLFFMEADFDLRSLPVHQHQVRVVTSADLTDRQRKRWQKLYGVNDAGVFIGLQYFDVTECLPHDAMHILLEGIVPLATKAILNRYINDYGLFTVEHLNDRILNFNFDYFSDNKPAIVEKEYLLPDNSLKQTASQMLALAHALPFLISDWVTDDEDLEPLKNHVDLLKIMNLSFAYEISKDSVCILERMIDLYIRRFEELYPNIKVPKFHFLTHIPGNIRSFGPGRVFWCMRFEAMHAYYKSLVTVLRCFKNLPKTLSYRRQVKQCASLGSARHSKPVLYSGDEIVVIERTALMNIVNFEQLLVFVPEVDRADCIVSRLAKVTQYGTSYKFNDLVLIACEEESQPLFGSIKDIFSLHDKIVIKYELLESLYTEDLNAYNVSSRLHYAEGVISLDELIFPHFIPSFHLYGDRFALLLYHQRVEFFG